MTIERARIVGDKVMVGDREMTRIYEPDHPLVIDGTYDVYGFKPAERRALEKESQSMAKSKPNGKANSKKSERSQPLPGMEQVRSKRLDNLCESIAEHRAVMNAARTDEQTDIVAALQEMQKKDIHRFTHNGVELARVPGAERLRVRLVKEQGDTNDDDIAEDNGEREFDDERAESVAAD